MNREFNEVAGRVSDSAPMPTPIGANPARASGIIPAAARVFLEASRVGHLATADAGAAPHVVPVCFACSDTALYITIDTKPKGSAAGLKRLRNIMANPQAAFIADHYDEDWSRLGWVMLRGAAEILDAGTEHDRAQALLRTRYPQYRSMKLEHLPVIALRVARVATWGTLAALPAEPPSHGGT